MRFVVSPAASLIDVVQTVGTTMRLVLSLILLARFAVAGSLSRRIQTLLSHGYVRR